MVSQQHLLAKDEERWHRTANTLEGDRLAAESPAYWALGTAASEKQISRSAQLCVYYNR